MTSDRWPQVKRLFDAAVARDATERVAFLAASCGEDDSLRHELESLLAADERSGDFSDLLQPRALADGSRLGPYEIVSFIGAGGMGEVYKACDTRLDRSVAIKVLSVLAPCTAELRARFEREARAVASLSHPHICRLYDVGSVGGVSYLVMEYLEGETLAQRLARETLSGDDVLRYAIQIAEALDAAHEGGVIHRDLKPANIMLTSRGATLLDFGLAKLSSLTAGSRQDAEPLTALAGARGTLHYMAPEQLAGRETDPRTDIFALGAVIYEMASGRKSVLAEDHLASPALDRVVMRCLARDPRHRWQSCKELLPELRTAAATPDEPRRRFQLTSTWAVSLAVVGVLAIGGSFAMMRMPARPSLESIAVLPFANSAADPELNYIADGITDGLISNLSRIREVRVTPRTLVTGYTSSRDDLQEMARDLGVDAVVTGRIVKRGDTLTIAAQLVDVRGFSQLWGGQYPTSTRGIGEVETTIATEIAGRLQRGPGQPQTLAKQYTQAPEAYEAYLKGRYYMKQRTQVGFTQAIAEFERAIEEDPSYALAYAGLADVFTTAGYFNVLPAANAYPRAKAAALRALQLDDQVAEAHSALGAVMLFYEWNFPAAEGRYKLAIELAPASALAHSGYSMYLASQGQLPDAIAEAVRAEQLDPVSPGAVAHTGWMFYFDRQYDRAVERARKALDLNRDFAGAYELLAEALLAQGLGGSQLRALLEAETIAPAPAREQLAYVEAVRGDAAAKRTFLASLRRPAEQPQIPPLTLAARYVALGDLSTVFEVLEKAYAVRAGQLVWLNVSPSLDPLRTDSRFGDLVRRIGLVR